MTRILIVEDDPLISRMYQKVLRFEGLDVDVAENGREGIEQAKQVKPNLILMDIMMPKMNGIEVLEILKSDPETKMIPVVMLTNLSGTQDAENAMKKGASDYLVKSQFKPKDVAVKVKEILANVKAPVKPPIQAQPAQQPPQPQPAISQDPNNTN